MIYHLCFNHKYETSPLISPNYSQNRYLFLTNTVRRSQKQFINGVHLCVTPNAEYNLTFIAFSVHSNSGDEIDIKTSPPFTFHSMKKKAWKLFMSTEKNIARLRMTVIRDVLYYVDPYDVTSIREITPKFLMFSKILSLHVKWVFYGEGSDESFGWYLYFHGSPNKGGFHVGHAPRF